MRASLLPAAFACAFAALSAAPASAEVFEDRLGQIRTSRGDFSERGERSEAARIPREEAAPRQRTRVARASISNEDEEDIVESRSPRRQAVEERKSRRATRRDTRKRHAAERRQRTAHAARAARRDRSPAWTRRSLSSAAPRGSSLHGVASYYWEPQRLATGGWFNPNAMTAAHKTLPFGTRVRVTHAGNGRSVDVTINDRGPYIAGRIIDLSRAAASAIGMTAQGVARVTVQILGR